MVRHNECQIRFQNKLVSSVYLVTFVVFELKKKPGKVYLVYIFPSLYFNTRFNTRFYFGLTNFISSV